MVTYKLNKPEPTPRRRWPVTVTLELSLDEAQVLSSLLGVVSGEGQGTRYSKLTGPLYHTFVGALKDAGVACVGSTILADENYNVRVVK